MQPGTAPKPMTTRHILSTARPHTPEQVATVDAVFSDSLKPEAVIKAIAAAPNCPIPCIANTAPIIAPRHFVVANLARGGQPTGKLHNHNCIAYSDVMIQDSG